MDYNMYNEFETILKSFGIKAEYVGDISEYSFEMKILLRKMCMIHKIERKPIMIFPLFDARFPGVAVCHDLFMFQNYKWYKCFRYVNVNLKFILKDDIISKNNIIDYVKSNIDKCLQFANCNPYNNIIDKPINIDINSIDKILIEWHSTDNVIYYGWFDKYGDLINISNDPYKDCLNQSLSYKTNKYSTSLDKRIVLLNSIQYNQL